VRAEPIARTEIDGLRDREEHVAAYVPEIRRIDPRAHGHPDPVLEGRRRRYDDALEEDLPDVAGLR
jgi:hypothetical protein